MSSIRITNVSKSYGKVAVLSSISCFIADHTFVTLLGPSGCGKTTLLRLIAGFEKVSAGAIYIDDLVVSSPDSFVVPEERGIGMVFQSYAVWPHMNVFENIVFPLKIRKVGAKRIKERAEEILEAMGLTGLDRRMPSELSGGQQQRVALGRALAASPRVLLLDEPLSNLDANLRESMRFEIKEVQRRFGITVVYVTHDQIEAMAMSDLVVVIKEGRIQQIDSPMRLYQLPANPFVAGFVGKINFLEAHACAGSIALYGGQSLHYTGEKRGDVWVAVRPENSILRTDRGVVKALLKEIHFLGETIDCVVEVQGAKSATAVHVFMAGRKYQDFSVGTQVWLDFEDYLVFDKEE